MATGAQDRHAAIAITIDLVCKIYDQITFSYNHRMYQQVEEESTCTDKTLWLKR